MKERPILFSGHNPCPRCGKIELVILRMTDYPKIGFGLVRVVCDDCGKEGTPIGWGWKNKQHTRRFKADDREAATKEAWRRWDLLKPYRKQKGGLICNEPR